MWSFDQTEPRTKIALIEAITWAEKQANLFLLLSISLCFKVATFEGWMEIMADAVDAREVPTHILTVALILKYQHNPFQHYHHDHQHHALH